MTVHQLPVPPADKCTVHVMPLGGGGFEVAHETRSGSSWGCFEHFTHAEDAIASAQRMAARYDCNLAICGEALAAVSVGSRCLSSRRGEF